MPALSSKAATLLSSTSVDMKTAASTPLLIVPLGKVLRIQAIVVRDATASLTGGISYSVTGWRQAFSLAALISAGNGYITVPGNALDQYTEQAAGTTINLTVTTGSTAVANATVDLFGYLT